MSEQRDEMHLTRDEKACEPKLWVPWHMWFHPPGTVAMAEALRAAHVRAMQQDRQPPRTVNLDATDATNPGTGNTGSAPKF